MRGKVILYVLLIFIFVTTQVTFLNFIDIFGVRPNLVIILIVSISLLEGRIHGAVVGFFAGLCVDAVVGIALGYHALVGMLLGLALGNINKRFFKENIMVMIICTLISTFLFESAIILISRIFGYAMDFIQAIQEVVLPEAIINAVLGAVIFFFIVRINRKMANSEGKNRY